MSVSLTFSWFMCVSLTCSWFMSVSLTRSWFMSVVFDLCLLHEWVLTSYIGS